MRKLHDEALTAREVDLERLAGKWVAIDDEIDRLWHRISIYEDADEQEYVVFGEDGHTLEGWRGQLARSPSGEMTDVDEERLELIAVDLVRRTLVCAPGSARISDFVAAARAEGLPGPDLYAFMNRILSKHEISFEKHSRSLYRFRALEYEYDLRLKTEMVLSEWRRDREGHARKLAKEKTEQRASLQRLPAPERVRSILREAFIKLGKPMRLHQMARLVEEAGLYEYASQAVGNYVRQWSEVERIAPGLYEYVGDIGKTDKVRAGQDRELSDPKHHVQRTTDTAPAAKPAIPRTPPHAAAPPRPMISYRTQPPVARRGRPGAEQGSVPERIRGIFRDALTKRGGPMRVIELADALEASGLVYANYQGVVDTYVRGWDELERVGYGQYRLRDPENPPEPPPPPINLDVIPRNPFGPLADFLVEQLSKHGRPMRTVELRDLAVAYGYRSDVVYDHVNGTLTGRDMFERAGKGLFRLSAKTGTAEPKHEEAEATHAAASEATPVLNPSEHGTGLSEGFSSTEDGSPLGEARGPTTVCDIDSPTSERVPPPVVAESAGAVISETDAEPPPAERASQPAKPQKRRLEPFERELEAKKITRAFLTRVGQKVVLKQLLDAIVEADIGLDEKAAYRLLLKWKIVRMKPSSG